MLAAILRNDFDESYLNWIKACEKFSVPYKIVEITKSDWLKRLESVRFNLFLACPPGREEIFKKMYDEKIYILDKVMKRFVYPAYDELSIHENKKYLSYWLEANSIPHPATNVFYSRDEAFEFANSASLPVVGKMNIGASGKGVRILRERKELINYINSAFTAGLRQEWGPNLKMGNYNQRFVNLLKNPARISRKLNNYLKNYFALQQSYVIFQEYIEHDFEWRTVKIGQSYFGHQKVKQGDKASGTKGINYIVPPEDLLDFVRTLCQRFGFNSMAVDLFEDKDRGYLVNEMQCVFGHVQSYICEAYGRPGRYTFNSGKWLFEEGMFNTNLSYNLRLEDALNILRSN